MSSKYKIGYLYKLSWIDYGENVETIVECIGLSSNGSMIVTDIMIIKGNINIVDGWIWAGETGGGWTGETCIELGLKNNLPEYFL